MLYSTQVLNKENLYTLWMCILYCRTDTVRVPDCPQKIKALTEHAELFINTLKGVSHEIFWVLFWHVWIDLGLYKNL
jgi:hypothetical protein